MPLYHFKKINVSATSIDSKPLLLLFHYQLSASCQIFLQAPGLVNEGVRSRAFGFRTEAWECFCFFDSINKVYLN